MQKKAGLPVRPGTHEHAVSAEFAQLAFSQQILHVARLFFALWPDENTRQRLVQIQKALKIRKGRAIPRENLHITLLFLRSIDLSIQSRLEAAADTIELRRFDLELDTIGRWPRSGVVWIAPATMPESLLRLSAHLRRIASEHAIAVDDKPFNPHLTLYRRGTPPGVAAPPQTLLWSPEEFCLVASETQPCGARYSVIRTWALAP